MFYAKKENPLLFGRVLWCGNRDESRYKGVVLIISQESWWLCLPGDVRRYLLQGCRLIPDGH